MNELEVQGINKGYNYTTRVFGNNIFVGSKFDEWEIKEISKSLFMLNHINNIIRRPTRCKKMRKHSQNVKGGKIHFHNLEYVFRYIKEHDDFILNGRNPVDSVLTSLLEE